MRRFAIFVMMLIHQTLSLIGPEESRQDIKTYLGSSYLIYEDTDISTTYEHLNSPYEYGYSQYDYTLFFEDYLDALKKEVNDDDAIEELAAIPFGVWMYSEVAPNAFLPELQNCLSKKELGILRKTNAVLFLFPVIDDKGEIREVKSIKITGDDRSVRNVSGRSIARLDRRFKEFFRFEDYGKMKRYSCEYQCVLGVSFSFSYKTISIGFPFPILSKE